MFFTKSSRSIRSIWQCQLRRALDACGIPCESANIPLYRSREVHPIAYRSAIAMQPQWARSLSPATEGSPHQLAREIVARLADGSNFAVSITPPAWIDCQLTDVGLAQWLQHWTDNPTQPPTDTMLSQPPLESSSADYFSVQYARARCCTLLRLAAREGLIGLASSETDLQIAAPTPLPWLAGASLRLQHPAERSLIAQLVAVVDALEAPALSNFGQLAIRLSQAFEEFDRHCRILGDLKTTNPALAISRCGLLGVTQKVLKCLFDEKFGIASPIDL